MDIKKLEGGDRGILVRVVTQEILEYIIEELSLDPTKYIMSPDGSLTRFRSEMNRNLSQMVTDGVLDGYEMLNNGDRWVTIREKLNRNFKAVDEAVVTPIVGATNPDGSAMLNPDGSQAVNPE